MPSTSRLPARAFVAACVGMVVLTGCSNESSQRSSKPSEAAVAGAGSGKSGPARSLAAIARNAHTESGSRMPVPFGTAREAMPTATHDLPGARNVRVSDAFVVGTVLSVDEGRSYAWPNGPDVVGQPSGKLVLPFNAPEAMVSTVYVSIDVERSVGADGAPVLPEKVRIAFTILGKADLRPFRDELPGTRVAAILESSKRSPLYEEDPDVYAILENGQFLGVIDVNNIVSFPAWESGDREPDGSARRTPLAELTKPIHKRSATG